MERTVFNNIWLERRKTKLWSCGVGSEVMGRGAPNGFTGSMVPAFQS